jgi:hypothetical protein
MNKNNDPIKEIRKIRHKISEEFEHNPKRYIEYLKKIKGDYIIQTSLYEKSPKKNKQSTDGVSV